MSNLADVAERYADYGDRVRVRPNSKANRPRSKQRPAHTNAETGMVIGVDRGRYAVILASGTPRERTVLCARASEMRKQAIVIGDSVRVVGDTSGKAGTLGRIVGLNERTTLLRRSADDTDRVERVMVANATQMLIVVAATNPEPRVGFVDRALVAAYDAGISPLICVTKTDLADPAEFLTHFATLKVPVYLSAPQRVPLAQLGAALVNNVTVLIGHSGVGKSTLINALVPHAARATGHVNQVTGRGRHTSSSSVALRFTAHPDSATAGSPAASSVGNPTGTAATGVGAGIGWVIDTPGVRSFGLGHVTAQQVISGFTELAEIIATCPRGCLHGEPEPDCALNIAAAAGQLSPAHTARLASLRRLLSTATAPDRAVRTS